MGSENERHTASRMAKAVNIAFAGDNGCGITVVIKGEHKMSAKRLSEVINLP